MRGLLVPLCVLSLAAAGCGGEGPPQAAPKPRCKHPAAAARDLARMKADVAAIARAAKLPTRDRLKGNAAVNAATDKFLYDMATAVVDLHVKNRYIDHAAAALHGSCEQCFQALEAQRPIPAITQGERGPGAGCGL